MSTQESPYTPFPMNSNPYPYPAPHTQIPDVQPSPVSNDTLPTAPPPAPSAPPASGRGRKRKSLPDSGRGSSAEPPTKQTTPPSLSYPSGTQTHAQYLTTSTPYHSSRSASSVPSPQATNGQPESSNLSPDEQASASARAAAASKRAEQNRRAQRAFRERRDQHMKELEAKAARLDATVSEKEEAARRLKECTQLVNVLRDENLRLRGLLQQYGVPDSTINAGTLYEDPKLALIPDPEAVQQQQQPQQQNGESATPP